MEGGNSRGGNHGSPAFPSHLFCGPDGTNYPPMVARLGALERL